MTQRAQDAGPRRRRRRLGVPFADEAFLSRLERLHLLAKRLAARGHPGQRRSRRLGDGLEFADHRDYAAGDDIRFIDWPYYARMEKLLLRLFHEHSEADVVLLLDTSASMAPGGDVRHAAKAAPGGAMEKFNYARRAAAALAYVAMGSLERVILQPFADDLAEALRSARSRQQFLAVLDFLAALAPAGTTDLPACVQRFAKSRQAPATVVLISDLLDCSAALGGALRQLAGRGHDVTVLHVYGPRESSPSLAGALLLHDAETGGRLNVTVTEEVLASYRERFEAFASACERACVRQGCTYAAAPTEVPFDQLVLNTLRRAGVLGG
jgi:uncharacterized protein (DUF58 family)